MVKLSGKTRAVLTICGCYFFFFLVRWGIFAILGCDDYLWKRACVYYIPFLSVAYSVLCCVLHKELLGYFTCMGMVTGFVAGYIVGPCIGRDSIPTFSNDEIVLLFSMNLFALVGFVVLFIRNKRGKSTPPLSKTKVSVCMLIICFALFALFSAVKTYKRLSFQIGAVEGYRAGYEQGMQDYNENKEARSILDPASLPSDYRFGTSKWKGYFIYWPSGYEDGYTHKK